MTTLTLLCGLPGSGKTTYACRLEERGSLRLSSDDWMVPLFGHYMPREVFDERLAVVRQLQWELTAKLLKAGVNVVLDDGFWTRAEREHYRVRAAAVGAEVRLIYFDVPGHELRRRLAERNRNLTPGTFEIDDAALDLFITKFEAPEQDERAVRAY
ncbi:ATP-binding protein [Deinococcus cavernae]|uniref:ATP-binding protein n=1 Tax=Deinococcus cavernae TaxID=2320857 RepID=A0A418V736_9DEIO|nr:AAA family ATPase [Deinococcus cavernae]RJF71901.1 ATP-binding protein [Deinococcus cavernae]